MSTSRPRTTLKTICETILAIFEVILMPLKPCCRESYNHFYVSVIVSILPKISIWDRNWKIGPFTKKKLVKVKFLDTYGVIVSSPKQFDLDRSKVIVTEKAHCVLKVKK